MNARLVGAYMREYARLFPGCTHSNNPWVRLRADHEFNRCLCPRCMAGSMDDWLCWPSRGEGALNNLDHSASRSGLCFWLAENTRHLHQCMCICYASSRQNSYSSTHVHFSGPPQSRPSCIPEALQRNAQLQSFRFFYCAAGEFLIFCDCFIARQTGHR